MSAHVFSEIFLHNNWHTDGDLPQLKPEIELFVHNYITNRCRETKGVFIEGVNGTEDHVHLAFRIEPHICISGLLGEIKGGSAFEANKHFGARTLTWQRGFGSVSFGKRQLKWVKDYIANQKEHHRCGTTFQRLEITGTEDP